MSVSLEERAYGCLLGGAIGDALGAPVEGLSYAEIAERHGRVEDFLSDAQVGTDDTDYGVFNALAILEHGREATTEQVEATWRRLLLAPGAHFRRGGFSDVYAARNLLRGLHPPASGAFNQQMWSDGVAMAIGAAGIAWPGEPEGAARLAAAIGAVSNGRDGIYAGQAVAAATAAAMAGADAWEMADVALGHVPSDSWTHRTLERVLAVSRGVLPDAPPSGVRHPLPIPGPRGDGVSTPPGGPDDPAQAVYEACVVEWYPWADIAPEAVALAFGALLLGGADFRRIVLTGVNFGRDADTIGAISGILAGALLGAGAIPSAWRERVRVGSGVCLGAVAGVDIRDVAARLVARFGPVEGANTRAGA